MFAVAIEPLKLGEKQACTAWHVATCRKGTSFFVYLNSVYNKASKPLAITYRLP
jgi:hypothetical protein